MQLFVNSEPAGHYSMTRGLQTLLIDNVMHCYALLCTKLLCTKLLGLSLDARVSAQ
jgi:hypothetical protein